MLKATNLSKQFGGVKAVHNMSFSIPSGKVTALIGPNGAGKSTVFNLLSGTMRPDQGEIEFLGMDITSISDIDRARMGLSRTFQLSRPFRNLTIKEHMHLALDIDDSRLFKNLFRKKQICEIDRWLELVGIDELPKNRRAGDISYGQGKLLGIAMALARSHELLLFDEPVAGVNPVIREKLFRLFSELRNQGETIFIIEHDMDFVMPLADQVIVMDRGKLLAAGEPEEIKQDQAVLSAYLGEQL